MEITELNDSEQQAFVGLALLMGRLDLKSAPSVSGFLDQLAATLGQETLALLIERAMERNQRPDAAQGYAGLVHGRQAKELIYGELFALATAGTIEASESALLDLLQQAWDLEGSDHPYRE